MTNTQIILGSASPRRQQLLQQAEIEFTVHTADIDESYPSDLETELVPIYIAQNKAAALNHLINDNTIVITADTVVILNEAIIGKPSNAAEAIATLQKLSGATHTVITGVCIASLERSICFSDSTEVEFNVLTDEQITHYVNKYQPYDKAGAYAIQEWIGVVGIKRINGSFYNVMGLPVCNVLEGLKEMASA
jgi:septum formation protein